MTPFQYAQLYWILPVALVNEAGRFVGSELAGCPASQ